MRVCCVICGDLFLQGQDVSATPCGHTFHTLCIIQWLERSKSCPQCRTKATEKTLKRLFFDAGCTDGETDPDALQQQVDNLKFQLKLKETEIKKTSDENSMLKAQAVALREEFKSSEARVRDKDTTIMALKTQLQYVDRMSGEAKKAKKEAKELREELNLLKGVEKVLVGTAEEVAALLGGQSSSHSDIKSLATFCSVLKKELSKTSEDKVKMRAEVAAANKKCKEAMQLAASLQAEVEILTSTLQQVEQDNESLEKESASLKKKVGALEQAIASPSDDVRNSAIHRLLSESPAPAFLKRLHSAEGADSVTPEVLRKKPRNTSNMESESEGTAAEMEEDIIDLVTPPREKVKKASLLATSCLPSDSLSIMKGGKGHHQYTFAKTKATTSLGPNRKMVGDNVGYDGLGGHHKVDVYPMPRLSLVKLPVSKRTAYRTAPASKQGSRASCKAQQKPKASESNLVLRDYFKNTFGD